MLCISAHLLKLGLVVADSVRSAAQVGLFVYLQDKVLHTLWHDIGESEAKAR